MAATAKGHRRPAELPGWVTKKPDPAIEREKVLSPSALGGAKALPSEGGLDEETAKRRGTFLHRLLEHLPLWPEADWSEVSIALLSEAEGTVSSAEMAAIMDEARNVLSAPAIRDLLVPEALSEVELTARVAALGDRLLHGTIDRLLVSHDRVLAVDYKSNAMVPTRQEDVPEGILRQMGAYDAMLAAIYPDRRIVTAILWTRTGDLMPLSTEIVRAALAGTTIP